MAEAHTGASVRDLQEAAKLLLQQAVVLLPGVTADGLARLLGVSTPLLEGWASPKRDNNVPLWILAAPGLPPAVREFLETGLRDLWAAARSARAGAPDCDHAWRALSGTFGRLLAAFAADVDGVTDAEEARARLPLALEIQRQANALVAQLERRAGVLRPVPSSGAAGGSAR